MVPGDTPVMAPLDATIATAVFATAYVTVAPDNGCPVESLTETVGDTVDPFSIELGTFETTTEPNNAGGTAAVTGANVTSRYGGDVDSRESRYTITAFPPALSCVIPNDATGVRVDANDAMNEVILAEEVFFVFDVKKLPTVGPIDGRFRYVTDDSDHESLTECRSTRAGSSGPLSIQFDVVNTADVTDFPANDDTSNFTYDELSEYPAGPGLFHNVRHVPYTVSAPQLPTAASSTGNNLTRYESATVMVVVV
ncbi:hypothetical protein ABC271_03525 [Microbacterium sp. 1P10AE]